MKAIPIRPSRQKTMAMFFGMALVLAVTLLCPGMYLAAAFLLPLLICPLMGALPARKNLIAAAAVVPAFAAFVYTKDFHLAVAVLAASCAPPVITLVLLRKKKMLHLGNHAQYLAAYIYGELMLLLWLYYKVYPMSIPEGLTAMLLDRLRQNPAGDAALYRLAYMNLLPKPDGFPEAGVYTAVIDPDVTHQLLLSAELRVNIFFQGVLPMLMVKTALVGSLFTLLRMQRHTGSVLLVDEEKKQQVTVANAPGFSMLALRKRTAAYILAGVVAGLVCSLSAVPWVQTVGQLLYWTGWTILSLAGAAAALRVLSPGEEKPEAWKGILVGLLWVFMEDILVLVLILEPLMMAFQTERSMKDKEEKQ